MPQNFNPNSLLINLYVPFLFVCCCLICTNTLAQSHWTQPAFTNDIHNNNAGNVGIGITAPTSLLHVKGKTKDECVWDPYGSGTIICPGSPILTIEGFNVDYQNPPPLGSSPAPKDLFQAYVENVIGGWGVKNSEFVIDGFGNVGIGTNISPTTDLDVAGNIRMRNGAQQGYIATSDALGKMTWQPPATVVNYWQPMSNTSSPGNGHIKNNNNGEVHIGNVNYFLFLDPFLGGGDYRYHSKTGDVGLFFAQTQDEEGLAYTEPGLVIGPRNSSDGWAGLRMDWDGNVCIGCDTVPPGFKLAVKGDLIAELVKVQLHSNWPDYVFEKDYKLQPLAEVEKFITLNGHLPGVPTASEIYKEGVDLAEMNRILLEKVEELTLHVIELEKKIK